VFILGRWEMGLASVVRRIKHSEGNGDSATDIYTSHCDGYFLSYPSQETDSTADCPNLLLLRFWMSWKATFLLSG